MRTRAFACRISPLPVYASFDRTMRIFRSALFAGGTAPNHAEFPLWSPRLGSVYTQQPSFVSTKYRLFFGRPSRGGLFGTFHVKRHLAGIGGFGRDHLEHHPAFGRPLEEPVVSNRQGSRRGEVEGEGGGGGPVLAAGAMALIAHQVAFLAIAGLTPLMGVGTLVTDRRRGRSSHRRQQEEYRQRFAPARPQLGGLLRDELRSLRDIPPDPGSALLRAVMPSSRVWERRREDDDFLTLRVGTGAVPASLEVSGAPPGPDDAAPLLHDAPVTLSLRSWRALGIAGPRPLARELARAIAATTATSHSPRDLAITVLPGEAARPDSG